jgi:hypothetical protein
MEILGAPVCHFIDPNLLPARQGLASFHGLPGKSAADDR